MAHETLVCLGWSDGKSDDQECAAGRVKENEIR